ncbi:MAG: hypothetical protein ACI9KE_005981, partial [Polyangiales bacterium]
MASTRTDDLSPGDLLAVPLGPLGIYGLAKVLGSDDNAWFVGALDSFATESTGVVLDAPLLKKTRVEAYPRYKGQLFVRGPSAPEGWRRLG